MKLRTYRAAAVITAAVFLLSAYGLYRGDFLSLSTPEKQVGAIRSYCSADETGVSLQVNALCTLMLAAVAILMGLRQIFLNKEEQ